MTVREMIAAIQDELLTDLQPTRAAELLVKGTSLLGNCATEIREADAAYAGVLLQHLESEEAANRAKIRAETTPAYLRKREARDTQALLLEMIRSLKYFLRVQEEEMKLSR